MSKCSKSSRKSELGSTFETDSYVSGKSEFRSSNALRSNSGLRFTVKSERERVQSDELSSSSISTSKGIFKNKTYTCVTKSEIDLNRCDSHRIYDIDEILGA